MTPIEILDQHITHAKKVIYTLRQPSPIPHKDRRRLVHDAIVRVRVLRRVKERIEHQSRIDQGDRAGLVADLHEELAQFS